MNSETETETSFIWAKYPQNFISYAFESTNSTEDNLAFQRFNSIDSNKGYHIANQEIVSHFFNLDTNFGEESGFDPVQFYTQTEESNQEEGNVAANYIFNQTSSNFTTTDSSYAPSPSEEEYQPEEKISKQSKRIKKEKTQSKNTKQKTQKNNKQGTKEAKKDFWTPEEDAQVLKLFAEYGAKWAKIASFIEDRSRKQIRDRYMNTLRPDIKNNEWTEEEEKQLLILHEKFGNKWALIASHLNGRTENQVKNKHYCSKRKQASKCSSIRSSESSLASPKFSEIPRSFEIDVNEQDFYNLNEYFSEDIPSREGDRIHRNNFAELVETVLRM